MKLDFLNNAEADQQSGSNSLLRLYDHDDFELMKLRHLIKRSLIDRSGQLIISNLDFVEPLNCSLTLQLSEDNPGIKLQGSDENNFLANLTKTTYINMLDIIDHLENGYNWLYKCSKEDKIDFLLLAEEIKK